MARGKPLLQMLQEWVTLNDVQLLYEFLFDVTASYNVPTNDINSRSVLILSVDTFYGIYSITSNSTFQISFYSVCKTYINIINFYFCFRRVEGGGSMHMVQSQFNNSR